MTAVYNLRKREEQILNRFQKSPPSFAVHLYPGHWTLNKDNNARTFMYTSPAVSILESIRAHRVPVDMLEMFDQANVPFYDGCLIVEEHDHMSADSTPDLPSSSTKPKINSSQFKRVVLYPNAETLWADINLMNAKSGGTWTDQQAIEFEAKVLVATAPPLCLDPDPVAARIAAVAMSSTSLESSKRKHSSIESDTRDDGARKADRDKFMNVMNPRSTRIFHADFRQQIFLEQNRTKISGATGATGSAGEQQTSSPSPSPQPSLAPTPTSPPASAATPVASIEEYSSSQKKKSKKKRIDSVESPMQIDIPSPEPGIKLKPRKDSITQGSVPQINGGKRKHGQNNRRGTASSVEPSPANPVMQLPSNNPPVESPRSIQASPALPAARRDDIQSALGIGVPPFSGHSPVPNYQQLASVGGPPKKRMKTDTPAAGNIPLPGDNSQQGTPQQGHIALAPHMPAPTQQPTAAPRYSASPAPGPGHHPSQQPHFQYPGQLAYGYANMGINFANGMMVNNGTGQPGHGQPAYNLLQGGHQIPQNTHANIAALQNSHAAARAGSPHSLPPSRPASQAGMIRNSPRPNAQLSLGLNGTPQIQAAQPDAHVRPASAAPGTVQQGMQQQPQNQMQMQMQMDPARLAAVQRTQLLYSNGQNMGMLQYPAYPMPVPGQGWRAMPGHMSTGVNVGRGQPLQYPPAMQRRPAMQAPPNPQR